MIMIFHGLHMILEKRAAAQHLYGNSKTIFTIKVGL